MIDFHNFETFDPNGPGLGNLFGQVSPFEALGIWPSGDFRLAPGDGAVPALGYYLGAAFATSSCSTGSSSAGAGARRRSSPASSPSPRVYAVARVGGTPYTAAKAIEVGGAVGALSSSCRCCAARPAMALRARRRRLLAARPRQRPGRPDLLLAGADRAAPAGRRRLDPGPRLRPAARRRTGRPLHRLGAARRTGLHRGRERSRLETAKPPPGRPLRRHRRRRAARRRSPACACAATPTPTCSGKRPRPPRGAEPLPPDRRPPGPPGPRPLARRACFVAHRAAKQHSALVRGVRVAWPPWRPRPERSPSSCPTASRWSCRRAPPAPTPPRRSGPGWPRRRWRSGSTASCATSPRRCPTAPRSASSPTATPRRSS